jgi:hypothetical protein
MQKTWDSNTPFETLIEQIKDAMEVADTATQAYTDAQILTLAYTLVYFDKCKTWNAKSAANKTWDLFKIFFLHAQAELRLQQHATSSCNGFSAYISDQENETKETLANIATAQASDCQAFCQLVTTNSKLAKQLRTALTDTSSLKSWSSTSSPANHESLSTATVGPTDSGSPMTTQANHGRTAIKSWQATGNYLILGMDANEDVRAGDVET